MVAYDGHALRDYLAVAEPRTGRVRGVLVVHHAGGLPVARELLDRASSPWPCMFRSPLGLYVLDPASQGELVPSSGTTMCMPSRASAAGTRPPLGRSGNTIS
jgi:hypothetical protein